MKENLKALEERIQAACQRSGRHRKDVSLLLATKKVAPERLREAFNLHQHLFGENNAQELLSKVKPLSDLKISWHFIGHLQSNKVKDVVPHCDLIHSVDRLSLAQEISKRSVALAKIQKILIEVNTSYEEAKSGVAPEDSLDLCREISNLPGISIQGLMTVAKASDDEREVKICFSRLQELSRAIQKESFKNTTMHHLSMGMSQDFEWAIEEGATILRIGSLVFGNRNSISASDIRGDT